VDVPLRFLTVDALDEVLRPRSGERMLEEGPGTGLRSLHIAPRLALPDGWTCWTSSRRCPISPL
jgi:hypothetical protein